MATNVLRKKTVVTDPVEPAVTPPKPSTETSFLKKPKITGDTKKRDIPEGLWTKCPRCKSLIYDKELDKMQPQSVPRVARLNVPPRFSVELVT